MSVCDCLRDFWREEGGKVRKLMLTMTLLVVLLLLFICYWDQIYTWLDEEFIHPYLPGYIPDDGVLGS